MDSGNFFSPSAQNLPSGDTTESFMETGASRSGGRSTRGKTSPVRDYATRTAASLRSIVERRYMRMNEAHDRIRTELLASHLSHMK
jgi:hypothetical protein